MKEAEHVELEKQEVLTIEGVILDIDKKSADISKNTTIQKVLVMEEVMKVQGVTTVEGVTQKEE